MSSLDLILDEYHSDLPDLLTKFAELGGAYFPVTRKLSKEELKEIYEKYPLASVIHQVRIDGSWYVLINNFSA
ncbi:MAG: hypothetical protein KAR35_08005 [Candidatus Heimdallarchaeota archaeon]|nr:hypothetical protein [Candidatus Heimdallarchaeota archaeon]MCK5049302.1 hypothetical protein [Candidatus Heimdallarchaeota archaeon]